MCMVEQCNRVWILTKNPFPSVREIIDKRADLVRAAPIAQG